MRILVVAAHLDDEILGCGGTILKHIENGDDVFVCIVTKGYEPNWGKEDMKREIKEAEEVDKIMGIKKRIYCSFPAVKLNTIAHGEINKKITDIVEKVNPKIIYTHFEDDINKDHHFVFNAVMVATRPIKRKIKVVCFETMSSTEWNYKAFIPNLYVNIEKFIDKKIEAFSRYSAEVKKYPHPRSKEGIRIWAKKRGIEVCLEYAEAFMIIRSFW